MADRNLRIRMLLEAGDKVTRPLRDIAGGSSRAAQALKATRDRLKEIKAAQADIGGFRELKMGLRSSSTELEKARAHVTALGRSMAQVDTPTRKMTTEFNKAKREAAKLESQHEQNSHKLGELRTRLSAAGIATNELVRHERRLRDEAAATNRELTEQGRRMLQLNDRTKNLATARAGMSKGMGIATGMAATGGAGIATAVAIGGPLVGAAKGAMSLEEGMAGVAKVTNMTAPQIATMTNNIVDLSTRIPMTAIELANIAAAAGAAGVGMDKMGRALPTQRKDLIDFTDAAARMGIAFDMTAEDAGGTMAKWRQAFKMTQPEVEALGDRVNALTNKFGGKAANVSEIVTRIGPLGKVAGIAAPAIAAMGSSLDSIGVESEIAATGIKNTLLALTKGEAATKSQTKAFGILGLSAEDVAKRMQLDANGTIVDVFERLAKLSPDRQASMLDSLFGSESISAIAPLLTNLDGLKQRLGLVGDKSQYAGSMTKEFLSRINTTQGVTDLASNAFQAVNISLGQSLLPTIKEGALRFGAIALRMRAFAMRHPELAKNALMVATGMAILFGLFGVAAIAMAALMGPIILLNAGLTAMGLAGTVASVGMLPIIATIAAVVLGAAALAAVAYEIYANWDQITGWFSEKWTAVKGVFSGGIAGIAAVLIDFNPVGLLYSGFAALMSYLGVSMPAKLSSAGRWLIMGLIHGITGSLGALKNAVVGAASAAATWFKDKLGIKSPSRVFASFGGFMMEGLSNGIARGEDDPVRRVDRLSRRVTAAMSAGSSMRLRLPQPGEPLARLDGLSRRITAAVAIGASVSAANPVAAGRPRPDQPAGQRYAPPAPAPITIIINGAPGQSERALAAEVERAFERHQSRQRSMSRSSFSDTPDGADQ